MSAFAKEMEAKAEIAKKDGFARWLNQPETRVLISLLPASDHQDLVQGILQAAYNSGFGTGQAMALIEVLMAAESRRPR